MKRKVKVRGRGRVRSYSAAKRLLDKIFSIWTRLRFADAHGRVKCVSCGRPDSWKNLQAGHFAKRSHLATRWHPENVAPQCVQCNIFKGGNYAAYAAWGVDRYGPDWPARMVSMSKESIKWTRLDLETLINDYEQRVARLLGDPRE